MLYEVITQYSAGNWTQLGMDIDGEAPYDLSGISVSLSADALTLAVGAGRNGENGAQSGHVRIYKYGGGAWMQVGADLDGEAAGDESGSAVALSADGLSVAVGAAGNDANGAQSGHVRIYRLKNLLSITPKPNRITSYNVCYTKLLRQRRKRRRFTRIAQGRAP